MIFREQEENGKHFSKLRREKSTVLLFAAFVETTLRKSFEGHEGK